jgi:membrane protein required for colicin V production
VSLFDLFAGLLIIASALVGWIRGGTREVATVAALVLGLVIAFFALRFTGPIARHAIHTAWLANITAILVVFVFVYILLRVMASALGRRIHETAVLGTADRVIGTGFGLLRALVVLGLLNLLITAATPPDRMPKWISGAALYPVSDAGARVLKAFAPQGAALARKVAPAVGHAVTGPDKTNSANAGDN